MATKTAKLVFCRGLALALMVAIVAGRPGNFLTTLTLLAASAPPLGAPAAPSPTPQPCLCHPSLPGPMISGQAGRRAESKAAGATAGPCCPAASPNPIFLWIPVLCRLPAPIPLRSPSQLTAREQQMLELINRDRLAHGPAPQADMRLTRLARLEEPGYSGQQLALTKRPPPHYEPSL